METASCHERITLSACLVPVLDRPKGYLTHLLRPNTSKAQTPRLATLFATHPFPARGVHGASEIGSNEPQRLSACSCNKLSVGYPFHDFVTARARCVPSQRLCNPPPLYMGLLTIPKVESISSSKPSLSNFY